MQISVVLSQYAKLRTAGVLLANKFAASEIHCVSFAIRQMRVLNLRKDTSFFKMLQVISCWQIFLPKKIG